MASVGFTVTGIVLLYPAEGVSPLVVGLSVLAFVFLIGIADWPVSKIVLGEERLEIVELFRQRSYRRSEFVSAKTDGGRVCLKRSQGDWLILPHAGNALGVCNSLRAWLKEKGETLIDSDMRLK